MISQTNLLQQETVLKNALSRTGVATSDLADVHIIPLDTIDDSRQDEISAARRTGRRGAEEPRGDRSRREINLDSNRLNLVGIKNSLKPTLQAFAELTNNGLTGRPDGLSARCSRAFRGLSGGRLRESAGADFPPQLSQLLGGISLNIPLRNRAAQSDYVTSLIEIRQNELNLQKQINQVRVDVQNAVIGLQQARARYDAAVQGRTLSQQTLDADQKKYELGAGTPYQVVQDQRDLASAQSSEEQAMANYSHARIALDQALGTHPRSHTIFRWKRRPPAECARHPQLRPNKEAARE